jgi:hypothetical protein
MFATLVSFRFLPQQVFREQLPTCVVDWILDFDRFAGRSHPWR